MSATLQRRLRLPAPTASLFLLLFARSANCQTPVIRFDMKKTVIIEVMDTLQKLTGYRFSYNLALDSLFRREKVSLHLRGESLYQALDLLFTPRNIRYRIDDKGILLSSDGAAEKPNPSPVLMQSLKGRIADKESHAPLAGVSVSATAQPAAARPAAAGCVSDSNGYFVLKLPVGNQALRFSRVGYEPAVVSDIPLISGKETFLNVDMRESAQSMTAVVVNAQDRKDRPLNSMATVSDRLFTTEDASRYAGGYDDPARMASAFSGVVSGGDARNDIIIRGNSPTGLLWKLEGVEIPSPNHFTNGQGDGGGVFSIINGGMLANSDFLTGAFPAEYGNALSGILDLNFRKGNSDKREYSVQAGMIGTQLSAEGPIQKANKSSYLFSYRYGNLQFLNQSGIISLGDNQKPPVFQDFNLNLYFPTRKAGNFSLFGIGGLSRTGNYSTRDSALWAFNSDLRNDNTEYHQTAVAGIRHDYVLSDHKTWCKTVLALTWQSDRYQQYTLGRNYHSTLEDSNRFSYPTLRLTSTYNRKLNAVHTLRMGFIYSQYFFNVYDRRQLRDSTYYTYLDQHGSTGSAEAFAEWKARLSSRWEITGGLHGTYFFLNGHAVAEPRAGLRWQAGRRASFSYGFGLHSRLEPISVYFAQISNPAGISTQPNRSLPFTRAMHHVLGYDLSYSRNLRLKIESYYQYLSDVPVIDNPHSTWSVLNALYGIPDSAYSGKGKGYNKGIDLTLEKFYADGYYFLLTADWLDSRYRPANGELYNTYFNTTYQVSALAGKDLKTGRTGQNVFSVNLRSLVHGGFRYSPGLAGTASNGAIYVYYPIDETYSRQTPTYIRLDAGLKFRKNNTHYSWIISLDVQNVTNRQNVLDEQTLAARGNRVFLKPTTDLGIIPLLNVKMEF